MKSWIRQKMSGIDFRMRCLRYGIRYLRASSFQIPDHLKINGRSKPFRFQYSNRDAFYYEFKEICIEDIYQIEKIREKIAVAKVLDIGANQGLFLIAARQFYQSAEIHAYEPNPALESNLRFNAEQLNAIVHMEAISDVDGKMKLDFGETDLNTQAIKSDSGEITAISLKNALERMGGRIDLLKLDCEGGEWALFELTDIWMNIRSVTMEYHLWARPGSTYADIQVFLLKMGYTVLFHDPKSSSFGIVSAYRKQA